MSVTAIITTVLNSSTSGSTTVASLNSSLANTTSGVTSSIEDLSLRNIFQAMIPVLIVVALWFVLLVLTSAVLFLCPEENHDLGQIYDGCTPYSTYHAYMIKLKLGPHSAGYRFKTSYVMIDIIDTKKLFITRVAIPPLWMSEAKVTKVSNSVYKNMRVTKFQLNRYKPLREVGYIRISHDCHFPPKSHLTVYAVEIKDLLANTVTSFPIDAGIGALGPHKRPSAQLFKAQEEKTSPKDDDMFLEGTGPYISLLETTVFIALYVNTVLVLTLGFALTLRPLSLTSLPTSVVNSVASSFGGALLTITSIFIFYSVVKRNFAKNHGIGLWYLMNNVYVGVMGVISAILGAAGAVLGTILENKKYLVNWVVAVALGIAFLVALYLPLLLYFGHTRGYVRYIRDVKDPKVQQPPTDERNMEIILPLRKKKRKKQTNEMQDDMTSATSDQKLSVSPNDQLEEQGEEFVEKTPTPSSVAGKQKNRAK